MTVAFRGHWFRFRSAENRSGSSGGRACSTRSTSSHHTDFCSGGRGEQGMYDIRRVRVAQRRASRAYVATAMNARRPPRMTVMLSFGRDRGPVTRRACRSSCPTSPRPVDRHAHRPYGVPTAHCPPSAVGSLPARKDLPTAGRSVACRLSDCTMLEVGPASDMPPTLWNRF